ncbi:MAG: hypothetical protein IAX21_00865 [Candidatus Bathyarchaeota archaeon]|nr:hypothetical protein [Candidatus Bathyarchaeum tardum]WGM90479.1 MAG: hypothetical protein NUK63_04980 [Candidatus Bathyarchaeum tardum]WNZ29453.1 MAG: hypothetical protein IAX21_00865 [Candidatus Bathyarchaeota archaeon]
MNATIIKNAKTTTSTIRLSNCEKKEIISETLKTSLKKLKDARKQIHKTVLMSMAMKEAGDDIANQVIEVVVEAFFSEDMIHDF